MQTPRHGERSVIERLAAYATAESFEKLPAPAPAAANTPMVSTSNPSDEATGVRANPAERSIAPRTMTRYDPHLSASTPKRR